MNWMYVAQSIHMTAADTYIYIYVPEEETKVFQFWILTSTPKKSQQQVGAKWKKVFFLLWDLLESETIKIWERRPCQPSLSPNEKKTFFNAGAGLLKDFCSMKELRERIKGFSIKSFHALNAQRINKRFAEQYFFFERPRKRSNFTRI